jgi:hypothetical protein
MRISVLAMMINGPAAKRRSLEKIVPGKEENPLIAIANNAETSREKQKMKSSHMHNAIFKHGLAVQNTW